MEPLEVEEIAVKTDSCSTVCAACGDALTGPDADSRAWRSWGAFWDGIGLTEVELLCGACGEYLSGFFDDKK